ncbi:hypothetical protein IF2G_09691 [Cordyceps javanica]|nr:hypothetical protein IF2G_09691 [Cordyceps javanica]
MAGRRWGGWMDGGGWPLSLAVVAGRCRWLPYQTMTATTCLWAWLAGREKEEGCWKQLAKYGVKWRLICLFNYLIIFFCVFSLLIFPLSILALQ